MSDDLRQLAADFGRMPADPRRTLRAEFQTIAAPVLNQARANASWPSRIPGATRISVKYGQRTAGVSIVVSARRAPHARPYENLGNPGTFRHPRWGHRGPGDWFPQAARPFLFPAAETKAPEVVDGIRDVVARVARENGFS